MESGFQRVAGWCEAAGDFMELASELCRRRSRKLFWVGGSGSSPLRDDKAQNICIEEGQRFLNKSGTAEDQAFVSFWDGSFFIYKNALRK